MSVPTEHRAKYPTRCCHDFRWICFVCDDTQCNVLFRRTSVINKRQVCRLYGPKLSKVLSKGLLNSRSGGPSCSARKFTVETRDCSVGFSIFHTNQEAE